MRMFKRWGFRIFLVFVLVVFLVILCRGLVELRKQNEMRLIENLKKQNELLQEEVKLLKEQVELKKEQVEVEMKVSKLKEIKVRKGRVIERMNATEVCNAFKEFGYDPICR